MGICLDEIGERHAQIAKTVYQEAVAWNEGRYFTVLANTLCARFLQMGVFLQPVISLAVAPIIIIGRLTYGLIRPKAFLTQCKVSICSLWLAVGGMIMTVLGVICPELTYHVLKLQKYLVYIPYIVRKALTADFDSLGMPLRTRELNEDLGNRLALDITPDNMLEDFRRIWQRRALESMHRAIDGECKPYLTLSDSLKEAYVVNFVKQATQLKTKGTTEYNAFVQKLDAVLSQKRGELREEQSEKSIQTLISKLELEQEGLGSRALQTQIDQLEKIKQALRK